jgi:hypothetical protein
MYACESEWYENGRLDVDGVRWFVTDPYPTWFRREDGGIITRRLGVSNKNSLAYTSHEWEEMKKDGPVPWADETTTS